MTMAHSYVEELTEKGWSKPQETHRETITVESPESGESYEVVQARFTSIPESVVGETRKLGILLGLTPSAADDSGLDLPEMAAEGMLTFLHERDQQSVRLTPENSQRASGWAKYQR